MSAEVYARGVWLKDGILTIKDGDLTLHIRHAPDVGVSELDFGEVDFGSAAYPAEIRVGSGERRREMEGTELSALKDRLTMIHNAVDGALQALKGIT